MRSLITLRFKNLVIPRLKLESKIAIVGGTILDPEAIILREIGFTNFTTFGIDNDVDEFLDLNLPHCLEKTFDLVVCSQVLEHLYDVKTALENLSNMLHSDGLLWLNFPISNRAHGSPHFYSAGYHPNLVTQLVSDMRLDVVEFGMFGSKRGYFFTHALRLWPSDEELNHPILHFNFNRYPYGFIKKCLCFLRDLPGRIYSCFLSNEISKEVEFATEAFILLKSTRSSKDHRE